MDVRIFTAKKWTLATDRPVNHNLVVEAIHNINPLSGLCCVGYRRDNWRLPTCQGQGETLQRLTKRTKGLGKYYPSLINGQTTRAKN